MKSGLSFSFVLKNLWARRLTTTLTVLGMALVVHVLLLMALTWGINWPTDSTPAVEAELWSALPKAAAPPPPPPATAPTGSCSCSWQE